ncbi:MAG: SRPBCC domain-containing protein [Luteimonas sp.]
MVDILHRVGIKAPASAVYDAIATREGLAGWWTKDTHGDSNVGGLLQFRFSAGGVEIGGMDMRVLELHPAKHVLWEVIEGPEEWVGTKLSWDLKQEDDYCIVLFNHRDWREPVEFMHHCSTKWAIFLMSLKSLVETGSGQPNPDDIKIDNWN